MNNKLFSLYHIVVAIIFIFIAENSTACGWWGDGESLMDDESVTVDSQGHIIQNQDVDYENPKF